MNERFCLYFSWLIFHVALYRRTGAHDNADEDNDFLHTT